jgi:GT2 family glycosyltransferase
VLARRTPIRKFLRSTQLNQRHLMADFDHARTAEVDWMLGACLLVRREVLVSVGLLDAGYGLYAEDIDWCLRAWRSGWRVVYFPEAQVIHAHQAHSDRRLLSWHSWIHLKSMWRYYRKHLAPEWLRLQVNEERLPT